jgi:hypothetical protein
MRCLPELKKLFVGRSLYVFLAVLLAALQLRADVTGSLSGYVRDSSGGVLPNATLTVIATATGYSRTAAADGSGHYSILALPPGTYRLTASNAGFENGVVDKITLNVNDELKFDFDLKIGNVSQTVSVDASTVQVDTANTRIEMFNVFNHANFTDVIGNANSGQFGQATNTASGRIGQLSGKFIF